MQVDLKDRKVKPKAITFHRKKNLCYLDISTRANYNVVETITKLLKQITKDPGFKLTEVRCRTDPCIKCVLSHSNTAALGRGHPLRLY